MVDASPAKTHQSILKGVLERILFFNEETQYCIGEFRSGESRETVTITGSLPGVAFATGHYRHGILLAPITAQEIAQLVLTGVPSEWIVSFSPSRGAAVPGPR